MNAAGEVALTEAGSDDVVEDPPRSQVGDRRLEAVAHLEPHLAIVANDQQEGAVIELAAPQLPGLGDPQAVVVDHLTVEGRDRQDGDLRAPLVLEALQACLDAGLGFGREHVGEVVDPAGEEWNLDRGGRQRARRGEHQDERHGR